MEARWEALYTKHQEVVEERCELEEAENDSRLRAQKWVDTWYIAAEMCTTISESLQTAAALQGAADICSARASLESFFSQIFIKTFTKKKNGT